MKNQFLVEVLGMKEVHEIPNAWTNQDYLNLLNNIDFEGAQDIAPEELREMTAMALSDLDFNEAVLSVLDLRIGDRMNKGQKQNLIEELQDDRIWEEYSDMSFHQELFNITDLLNLAFPKKFSEPDSVKITLSIKALNVKSQENLNSIDASFLARLLNDGMDQHNIIYRLFDEQLVSNHFPESENIIWQWAAVSNNENEQSKTLEIFCSWSWVDELKGVKNYESTAYSDS